MKKPSATPALRIVNTMLEEVLVLLLDGGRTGADLADAMARRQKDISSTTVYRAIHGLRQRELIVSTVPPKRPGRRTIAAGACLAKALAAARAGRDPLPILEACPEPAIYTLTPVGRQCALMVKARKRIEKTLPAGVARERAWQDFARALYVCVGVTDE